MVDKTTDYKSVKDRILEFCVDGNIKPATFERLSGLSNGYLSKLRHEPSRDKLDNILNAFPQLNKIWLLTGEGDMLNSSTSNINDSHQISTGKVIPYYDAEVAAGTAYGMEMTQTRPSGMIEIGSLMKDSEFALRIYGNSMVPNYPAGCVVGLKQYTENFIEPGSVYVIETSDNRLIKRLYYNKDKTAFRCLSDNHMKHESGPMEGEFFYPEFEIPFTDVKRLLLVTGVIKRNIL